jgi:uncharacterized protein (DUF58 family)
VVLDSRASGHRGTGSSGSLEWAVTAAASVTAHLCEQTYAVHLVTDETADSGRAGAAIDLDHALEVLAEAHTGQLEQFAEVLHCAHPLTSSGGLVIAIVTELDEALARQVAALRQPGGTGLAMVLDAQSFATQRRPAAAAPEPPCVSVLRSAGWTVAVVRADDRLATVWTALAGASSPVPA